MFGPLADKLQPQSLMYLYFSFVIIPWCTSLFWSTTKKKLMISFIRASWGIWPDVGAHQNSLMTSWMRLWNADYENMWFDHHYMRLALSQEIDIFLATPRRPRLDIRSSYLDIAPLNIGWWYKALSFSRVTACNWKHMLSRRKHSDATFSFSCALVGAKEILWLWLCLSAFWKCTGLAKKVLYMVRWSMFKFPKQEME